MPHRRLSPRRPHVLRTPIVLGLVMLAIMGIATAQVPVDPALPSYQRVGGVAGTLTSLGSETLSNLLTLWAEGFRVLYPHVAIQIEAKGSGAAPPALTAGTTQLGPMSRAMKPSEQEAFAQRYGYPPTAIPVALDAIAIVVHKDNPLTSLTLAQLDAIFSSTHIRGGQAHPDLGRPGVDGGVDPAAPVPLWPQQCLGDLCVLQGTRAAAWGFSGDGAGTARRLVGGARGRARPRRDGIYGHWRADRGREGGGAGRRRGGARRRPRWSTACAGRIPWPASSISTSISNPAYPSRRSCTNFSGSSPPARARPWW